MDRVDDEPGGPGGGPEEPQFFNTLSSDNFPSLGNATPHVPLTRVNFTSKVKRLDGAEFPSLGKYIKIDRFLKTTFYLIK